MSRLSYWVCAIFVLFLSGYLRFANLGIPPVHFDEATGARILSFTLEGQPYRFNPTHFHGPLLTYAGGVGAWVQGQDSWQALNASGIRNTTATAGLLVVVLLLSVGALTGWGASLFAALIVGVSPVLTHFNRLFIHESLLVLMLCAAGIAAAWWWRTPNLWLAVLTGIFIGLAGATRATFVMAPATWIAAVLVLRFRPPVMGRPLLIAIATACGATLFTLFVVYSGFFTRPSTFFDFISTYWRYQTTEGHEKAFFHYASLYLLPFSYGRIHWWLGGSFMLAACCLLLSGSDLRVRAARLLFLSALMQAAVFSFISYKVPWLMLMPWTQILVAAGLTAAVGCSRLRSPVVIVPVLAVAVLGIDLAQAWRLQVPAGARETNPLQYVATHPRVEVWTARTIGWLNDASVANEVVAVVGAGPWPLPWYLRPLPRVGYWDSPPPEIMDLPLVISMPAFGQAIAESLEDSHFLLYEGLRTDTPVYLFLRNDVWERVVANSRR